jgi:phage FluMu protein Com
MPTILDALLDQSELAQLYMLLLKQKVKEKYKGHQDYHLMLNCIDSDVPIVGGEITVQKEDRNGNFYTVTYHITVKDDLGNFIQSVDDLGGQCMKGEIVKKGYVFTCVECGEPFCRRHIKFVDNNYKKALCRYGLMGWEGCYATHWKQYTDGGIHRIREATEHVEALAEFETAKKKLEAVKKGQYLIEGGELKRLPQLRKKTGPLGRFLHGSVQTIRCGNCNRTISLAGIRCPNCQNIIDIDIDSPLICPLCEGRISQVDCPDCEAVNRL